MTPERFEALAEAYGGDPTRWPAAERDGALAWMAERPNEAQAVLERAAELDDWLAAAPAPRASGELAARITAAAPQRRVWRNVGWWLPAGMGAGLAAACAAGVLVGLQIPQPQASEADAVLAAVTEGLDLYADEGA